MQELLDISRPGTGNYKTRKSEGFPAVEYRACIARIGGFRAWAIPAIRGGGPESPFFDLGKYRKRGACILYSVQP